MSWTEDGFTGQLPLCVMTTWEKSAESVVKATFALYKHPYCSVFALQDSQLVCQ